jgi:transposase
LSGEESVSAVAKRHGVTAQQLYGWRRRAGAERTGSEELGFATVVVARSATSLREAEAASLRRRQVEIELCGMTIRVPPGGDGATLRAVLQAVKAVS